jgi:hypothetical protein
MQALRFCFRMSCLAKTLLVVVALFLVLCEAQVNFSPNWGKRSGLQDGPCKASTDSLMYIYKLIQVMGYNSDLINCRLVNGV